MPKIHISLANFFKLTCLVAIVLLVQSCKLADILPKKNADAVAGTYIGTSIAFGGQSVPLPFTSGAQVLEVQFVLTKVDNDNVKFELVTIETVNKVKDEQRDAIEKVTVEKKAKDEYSIMDNGDEIATIIGKELTYVANFDGVSASIIASKK